MISIVDDRIVSVSAMDRVTLPAGVRGVDVSGAFVVPGLFDMHAHSFCAGEDCGGEPKLKRYVDAGVRIQGTGARENTV